MQAVMYILTLRHDAWWTTRKRLSHLLQVNEPKKDSKIPNSNFSEIIRKAMRIDAAWLKEIHILSCPNDLLSMLSLLQ